MNGQERFRVELNQLQDYCQQISQAMERDETAMDVIQDVCGTLRSHVGRLFGIAEELNETVQKGITLSVLPDALEESNALFDCIQSFRRPSVYYDLLFFEEAVRELKRILDEKTDPHVIASAYNGLGHLYAVRKMYPVAIHFFSKVIEYYPSSSDGYFNLGAAWFNLGSYEEARQHFHQAVYHHPNDWEAYFHLGRTYDKLGDVDSAVYYMQRAREIKYCQSGVAVLSS